MHKNIRRVLIISSAVFLVIVLLALLYTSVSRKPTLPEYMGMKTYPKAQFQETTTNPENEELVKTTLTTKDNVPNVSNWFLKNYLDSGWEIDTPPADTQAGDIQYIRLVKNKGQYGDEYLRISLIKGNDGQTQIILENSNQAMQQKGEEDE